MQRGWTLSWAVLLLIGHFQVRLCQAQEPTGDDNDPQPPEKELGGDSVLSHIHFSDDTAEEWNETTGEEGGSHESLSIHVDMDQAQCPDMGQLYLFHSTVFNLSPLDRELAQDSKSTCTSKTDDTVQVQPEYRRPVCKEGESCDIPLNCYDFVANGPSEYVPDPPRTIELTPLQLQSLLANGTYKNCCALVMFYAPWCEYSVNFAQKFNAIGRTFLNLPVIAVDLSAHDPHKFVLAYLPVIAFYHFGKVIYKFKLDDSYEKMVDQIVKMTEFNTTLVDFDDEENFHPVPIEREKADRFYLRLAVGWLLFVVVVTILRTKTVADSIEQLKSRFLGPTPAPAPVAADDDAVEAEDQGQNN